MLLRGLNTDSMAAIGAISEVHAALGIIHWRRDKVNQPVHGIRAIKRRAWPAHHFNAAAILRLRVHQRINIGKARCAHGNTIFEIKERTGTGTAHQYRRANSCQMLLPTAAMNMHAGGAINQFNGKQINRFRRVDGGDIARIIEPNRFGARGGHNHFVQHSGLRYGGHKCRRGECRCRQ